MSQREVCPRCNGGNSGEKSLSITRSEDGHLVWQCFRMSCPEKGGTNEGLSIPKIVIAETKPRKEFSGTTKPLTEFHLARIKALWGIENPPYWYYTPDYGGRVAMSIRSPKYMHRGWVLRDIRGTARNKALMYMEPHEETLSWYRTNNTAPTVLVEDIPSSVRASRYMNAVALLGTKIGMEKAIEIAEYAQRPIIIALDQDATRESFKHAKKYGLMWGDVRILPLTKDLKNMSEDEVRTLLTK